ncbi:MAG: hypothetical protein JXA74_13875, partial [Anaerolineae bacterium]|nr:hypothetical protein [Anaerolineae bacterium]
PVGYAYAAAVVVWPLALALALGMRRTPPSETSSEPHWLSREAGLVISLILLGNMALATLLGTLAPTIMEALRGRAVAVSQSFYEGTVGWLGLALLFVLGVCPSLTWGHTRASLLARRMILPAAFGLAVGIALSAMGLWSGFAVPSLAILAYAFAATLRDLVVDLARSHGPAAEEPPRRIHGRLGRTRRRLGADLVHLALLLMALGIVGSNAYGLSGRIALRPGESAPVGGYTLSYTETVREALPRSERLAAQLTLARSGRVLAELAPERNYYAQMEQWVSEVAVYPGLGQDLYIILEGITDEGIVGLGVLIIPLVSWLWIGGALLLLGGAIAWWPARQRPKDAPSL